MKNVTVGKMKCYHPSKIVSLKFFWEKPNKKIKRVNEKKKHKKKKKNLANNGNCCVNWTEPLSRLSYNL